MNRRNLIKSIPLLGFAPFVQAEEYPWPLECTLAPFQKKIWEAYNKYDKNIFVLPPKSGATFMYNRLYEIAMSRGEDFFLSDGPHFEKGSSLSAEKTKVNYFVKTPKTPFIEIMALIPNGYNILEFTKEEVRPLG